MLRKLTIDNAFAHQHTEIDFITGFTAISGKNGKGKSELVDCIRFAFWGSQALRTPKTDYNKAFRVELTSDIRGETYRIVRMLTKAELYRGEELIGTGTTVVNAKITALFGYDMRVFDTANVVRQNKIAAMSEMQPADRKRMVDTTIGLDTIDTIIKWCADDSKNKQSEAAGVMSALVVPVEPIKPEGYTDSEAMIALHQVLTSKVERISTLRRFIREEPSVSTLTVPVDPRAQDELRGLVDARAALALQLSAATTERAKHGKPPQYSSAQLDAFEATMTVNALIDRANHELSSPVAPAYSLTQLEDFDAQILAHENWKEWMRLSKRGDTTCPACNHTWYNAHVDMAHCGDWKDKPEPPLPPIISRVNIAAMTDAWRIIDGRQSERAHATTIQSVHGKTVTPVPLDARQMREARQLLAEEAQQLVWQTTVDRLTAELAATPDVRSQLQLRVAYDRQKEVHDRETAAYAAWAEAKPGWEAELAELGDVGAELDALAALRVACATYDRLRAAHAAQTEAYTASCSRIATLTEEAEQLQKARVALAAVKSRVKTHLVPSLSKVASLLLRQMTGGLMNTFSLDQDFDARVDSKVMEGLSGAELAAGNLAFRIGLGQVLTNRVFSVLIADEPDKDMDDERAPFVAACLRNLTKTISQVIIVSHKKPEADAIIEL